jgi:hypothetical protein
MCKFFVAFGAILFSVIEANAAAITINYTGTVTTTQIFDPYIEGREDFVPGITSQFIPYLGPTNLNLTTVIYTTPPNLDDAIQKFYFDNIFTLTITQSGFYLNHPAPDFFPNRIDSADGNIGSWNVAASTTLDGSHVIQDFTGYTFVGGTNVPQVLHIDATLGAGGAGYFSFLASDPRSNGPFTAGAEFVIESVTTSYMATAIPEPSSWAMLLIGFAGIAFAAYHRLKPAIA